MTGFHCFIPCQHHSEMFSSRSALSRRVTDWEWRVHCHDMDLFLHMQLPSCSLPSLAGVYLLFPDSFLPVCCFSCRHFHDSRGASARRYSGVSGINRHWLPKCREGAACESGKQCVAAAPQWRLWELPQERKTVFRLCFVLFSLQPHGEHQY